MYIAVPNAYHAPLAVEALNAGKHVILEKPFAMNLAQAKEVTHKAAAEKRIFMLGMNQRFTAGSQKIKSLAKGGLFGDLYHAKASWMRRSGIPRLGTWFGSRELDAIYRSCETGKEVRFDSGQ